MQRKFKYKIGDKVECFILQTGFETGEVIFVDEDTNIEDQLVYKVLVGSTGLDYWAAETDAKEKNWYILGPAE